MISFNSYSRVEIVGRLARDPESRSFDNGGKVCRFAVAVSNRKKNSQTGEWEDNPAFIDVDVWNRGENGKDADHAEEKLAKGGVVHISGRLEQDKWQDSDGNNRSKLKVVADYITFLDAPKGDGGGRRSSGGGGSSYDSPPENSGGSDDEIPF